MDFARDIQPILRAHCYECHGAKKTKNGLRLDVRAAALKGGDTGPAIEPGNSEHSLIVRRLLGLDGEDQMPKDKDPLDAGADRVHSPLDRSGRALAGHRRCAARRNRAERRRPDRRTGRIERP